MCEANKRILSLVSFDGDCVLEHGIEQISEGDINEYIFARSKYLRLEIWPVMHISVDIVIRMSQAFSKLFFRKIDCLMRVRQPMHTDQAQNSTQEPVTRLHVTKDVAKGQILKIGSPIKLSNSSKACLFNLTDARCLAFIGNLECPTHLGHDTDSETC